MRNFLFFVLFFAFSAVRSQQHPCAAAKQTFYHKQLSAAHNKQQAAQISHEMNYDVKFVHLDLNVERNTKYLSGNAKTVATVTSAVLDTFITLLHLNLTIDSIYFNQNKITFIRQDSMVKCGLTPTLSNGSTFTAQVYYKGMPPTGGAAIGSGFSNGTSGAWGNQATWSLSESFVGYHWWPCKQVLTDKIDSSWVFITTDSLNKGGSNGLLTNVVTVGSKKRYEWKSRYTIDYYLISVAVSRYKEYNLYAKPQYLAPDSILIQNYIYDNAINNPAFLSQKTTLDKIVPQMEFLCDMYGMYPFHEEKYGHCMTPFSGGMEHQTMSSVGFFDYYINAHELGHQWWGDNVTCKSWSDIWINEGFASYTEHLVAEYLDPTKFQSNLFNAHANVMSQPGGSVFFTNNDTMNTARIFSGRLTYDKGGAIVHSLRFLTNNDSVWFNTLRGFQNTFKNSTASVTDFRNYYQAQTGIDPTVFFNQWYYGQGYPTFNVKYNFNGSSIIIQTTETTSMPSVTPLFDTPIEYRIGRTGFSDTTIRVIHDQAIETYTIPLSGNVTGIIVDPDNWLINKSTVARDFTLGVVLNPVSLAEQHAGTGHCQIIPNPALNSFSISGESLHVRTVRVTDLRGAVVIETDRVHDIEIGDLQKGVYLVTCFDAQGVQLHAEKLVKD